MSDRISKPDMVRKLIQKWSAYYTKSFYLKSVTILEGEPLRGIKDSSLSFRFPVTVICGTNGAGKTTFLSLSILGFHAIQPPQISSKNIKYYDFSYFYPPTARDKHKQGICIKWEYTNEKTESLSKGHQRWMRYIKKGGYPRRPERGTEFIGISRSVPPFEKSNYKNYFANKLKYKEHNHTDELRHYLSNVISKPYYGLSKLTYKNSSGAHKVHSFNNTHTSFNAGAGEDCLSTIFDVLLSCPEGSLVAIEEIEIGLHPSILPNLVDAILEITLKRNLQVLITSHSPEFLRACPKEALVLAERYGDKVEFSNEPNVEYAIRRIGGSHHHSLSIVCEDKCSEKIISNALPNPLRSICLVAFYGGKDELIKKAEVIRKHSPSQKIAIVWDGAVPVSFIEEANKQEFIGCKLPGNDEPEIYFVTKLKTDAGKSFLKERYKLTDPELNELCDRLVSASDPHDIPYLLASCLNMNGQEDSIIDAIAGFIATTYHQEFNELTEIIRNAIDT